MKTETYKGYTNWETWCANLWICNDEYYYKASLLCDSVNALKALWRCMTYSVTDKIDIEKINFEEIYDLLKENREENYMGYTREIVWSTDDILELNEELSFEDCKKILDEAVDNYDANVGITWEVLQDYLDIFISNNNTFPK